MDWIFLAGAAFLAGLIDAVAGGGGLILIPALFVTLPEIAPAMILGTNKFSAIFGTTSAAVRYVRSIQVPWLVAFPAALAALIFSWFGAMAAVLLPKDMMRPLVLLLLVSVATYSFVRKDFGSTDENRKYGAKEICWAFLLGAFLGFYDGFFGPGTGSFLIFLYVQYFGLNFLRASSAAKIVNVASNAGALVYFGTTEHILWKLAMLMAACNIFGAVLGSHLAVRHGSLFVRRVFLLATTALIAKFGYDTLTGSAFFKL
ncbi:MAG: TSUP family transporter [Betaproteobacteria bacterium]|nr:TSUP family transporter [Betaproteobacteria bacterium]